MTQAEYEKAYAATRNRAPVLTRTAMRRLKETYVDAAAMAAEAVRKAEKRGLSEITVASRQAIEEQLRRGAEMVRDAVDNEVPLTVRRGAATVTAIDSEYMIDAARDIPALSAVAIRKIGEAVNNQVVEFVTARVWEDGLTFSERVWQVGEDYAEQIRRTLTAGLAQNRDVIEIARDLEVYTVDGKPALAKRYGQLEAGTERFVRRIRRNIDYRALRLVRTELYAGLQEAGRQSGRNNPGAKDEYDWVMEANRQHWDCTCPTLAANGPYTYDTVPGIPHPNCSCDVRPRLMDTRSFVSDLKAWANGESRPYIDKWYNEIYRPAAR